jgi:outer membrane autotransporter protein
VTASTDSFVNNGTLRISTGPLATSTIANLRQTGAGTLELRANAGGGIDRLVVNGGSLAGTLRVVVQPQLFANTTLYQNAIATSGVTGTFDTVLVTAPLLRASTITGPGGISVRLDRVAFNALGGLTRNQREVATALEGAYAPTATGQAAALFGSLFAAAAPQAVFQEFASAAEVGTAVQNASFGLGTRFLDQLSRQSRLWRDGGGATRVALGPIVVAQAGGGPVPLPGAPPTNLRLWVDAFADDSRFARDRGDGSARVDVSSSGISVGADFSITPELLVGAAIGFGTSDADFDGASGRARTDSVFLGAYGSYRLGQAYLDASLGVGFNSFETRRRAATGEGTEADFDGTLVAARLEGGRRFDVGPIGVTPFAGLTILSLSQDSFAQRAGSPGAGGLFGVAVDSETTTSVRSMLGVEVSAVRRLSDNAVGTARLRVGWAHEFEEDRQVDARIIGVGGPSFRIRGAPAPRDALVLGLGADVAVGRQLTLFANLAADIGNDGNTRSGISGGLRYAF